MHEITAQLGTGTAVSLANGRHEWRGDEPPDKGGRDTGPSPYELLLGSLAACTLITLRMYCDHKGIALAGASATYEHDKAEETDGEGRRRTADVIRGRVRIEGEFSEQERKRLAQIVSRCPVHRTLEGGARLEDEVEFA
ncbi:MAG: OsmC family protein [Gemmatimonadota bacterium]|nr:OsmC family protein [Gemmatimonadota bacterium]